MSVSLVSVFKRIASKWYLTVPLAALFTFACAGNFYEGMSNKTTDDALYEDALKLIDAGSYTSAISKLLSTSTTFQAQRAVIRTLSGAYAGRCGQDLISMSTGMSGGASAAFTLFMNLFRSISVTPADCYSAQTTLETIGNSSVRTADENFYMFFLGVSKAGSYLKSIADTNGDGTTDALVDPCYATTTAGVVTGITDPQMKQIITGLGLIFDNFTAVSASLGGNAALSGLNTFKATCALLTSIPNCAITDPTSASLDANTIAFFRNLLVTTDMGIKSGICTSSDALPTTGATVCCPTGIH